MDGGGGGEYSRQVARTTIPESTLASVLWFLVVLVLVIQASWRSPQGIIIINMTRVLGQRLGVLRELLLLAGDVR